MPKLPQISGLNLIKVLVSLGYIIVRQKGSHVNLKKDTLSGEHSITIPKHTVLAKGTLNDILSKVSLWNSLSKEEILKKVK
jgi:predicted RNA binding protein YcfA (HicA-like mRNA interferase family)